MDYTETFDSTLFDTDEREIQYFIRMVKLYEQADEQEIN